MKSQPGQSFYTVKGARSGYGRKLRKPQRRDCQRCGRSFKAVRDVPYCLPCWREKHGR